MTYPSHITIKVPSTVSNRVMVIKAVRSLTGMGLKESKDICDATEVQHRVATSAGLTDTFFEEYCRVLRSEGCEVNGSVHRILQDLRNLGAEALQQGHDDLANEILQLVLAEKLRHNEVGM